MIKYTKKRLPNSMKILFDSQIFDLQKYGGISRYFSELWKNIQTIPDIQCSVPILKKYSDKLKFIRTFFNRRNKSILKKQDFDIFHPTYYSTYFLKSLKNKPFVLTVYDMIHEKYSSQNTLVQNFTMRNKKKLMQKASHVIAISQNTKKDILDFYSIPENKITVIHLANSLKPDISKCPDEIKIPKKYILFVGARDSYKNFILFIKSIAPLLQKDRSLHVITVGGRNSNNTFSKIEQTCFIENDVSSQILHFSAADDFLIHLYKNALCFAFPSLYEGFGIPILEAFACDCPVVASNTSSLPEVGGDAVLYFDPSNTQSICEAVEKVISDESLRAQLVEKGKERLKLFSWEKTARETVEVYKKILQKHE